jgi:hypothetical protein
LFINQNPCASSAPALRSPDMGKLCRAIIYLTVKYVIALCREHNRNSQQNRVCEPTSHTTSIQRFPPCAAMLRRPAESWSWSSTCRSVPYCASIRLGMHSYDHPHSRVLNSRSRRRQAVSSQPRGGLKVRPVLLNPCDGLAMCSCFRVGRAVSSRLERALPPPRCHADDPALLQAEIVHADAG